MGFYFGGSKGESQDENLYMEEEKSSWWKNFRDGLRDRFRRGSASYDSESEEEEAEIEEEIDEDLILKVWFNPKHSYKNISIGSFLNIIIEYEFPLQSLL